MNNKALLITMGDPAGIGPELAVRCAVLPEMRALGRLVVVGDGDILRRARDKFCPEHPIRIQTHLSEDSFDGLDIWACTEHEKNGQALALACPSALSGALSLEAVKVATDACLNASARAMITAPLSKEAVEMSGTPFLGHTGWIAERCGVKDEMMLMTSPRINVAYVSTHVSIAKVSEEITQERVLRCLHLLDHFLKCSGRFGRRIVICGLNPHAGENGLLGSEELDVIIPAVKKAQEAGIQVDGPHPADTLFLPEKLDGVGAFLAMYHDQGCIPFKMLAFDDGVNTTLGLPLIRTSVDHGTAWDLAWQGKARTGSMLSAILTAAELTRELTAQ